MAGGARTLPPTFGAVLWGDVRIFLCVGAQGGHGEHGVWMSIFVDDVDAVYARCVSAKAWRSRGLRSTRCGACGEFHLRHPDGHIFRIGTGTDEE